MHRPLFIAAFVLLLVCGPVSAQHGGGHASGGGHGFSGGHGGFGGSHGGFSGSHMGGGHTFGGGHSGSSFAGHPSGRGFASRPSMSSRGGNRGRNHSGVGVRIRTRGFRNNRFGNGFYGFPWWYGGFYDPYWWWDSGSRFDDEQQNETGLANEMNQQSLEEQRQRQQDDQDTFARTAPLPPARQARPTEILPATVLVFRDQHRQDVQNYAIVGQTLWNFAPEHTQKIPLSDLDLPATTKANDERGVDFRLPGAHEGQ
jgi:hypothetical protein